MKKKTPKKIRFMNNLYSIEFSWSYKVSSCNAVKKNTIAKSSIELYYAKPLLRNLNANKINAQNK